MKRFALSMPVGLASVALFFAGPVHAGGLYLSSFGDPSDDWAGRFETTEITLFTSTFMPTVAVRVTDRLSVGAGAAVSYGKLDMRVRAPIGMEPEIRLKDVDDWAAAPIASILIEPTPELRFGVVYQGETEFHLDGKTQNPRGRNPIARTRASARPGRTGKCLLGRHG
jgi:long-chain fatty acid transport protein